MPVVLRETESRRILEVVVRGQLEKADYEQFAPEVEARIEQQGRIRIFLELHDFAGWDGAALWEDIKFNARHFDDIERLAIVGERRWEARLSLFCKPFTNAEIRFFEAEKKEAAQRWIREVA